MEFRGCGGGEFITLSLGAIRVTVCSTVRSTKRDGSDAFGEGDNPWDHPVHQSGTSIISRFWLVLAVKFWHFGAGASPTLKRMFGPFGWPHKYLNLADDLVGSRNASNTRGRTAKVKYNNKKVNLKQSLFKHVPYFGQIRTKESPPYGI